MLNRVNVFRETCSISLRRFPKYIAPKFDVAGRQVDIDIAAYYK